MESLRRLVYYSAYVLKENSKYSQYFYSNVFSNFGDFLFAYLLMVDSSEIIRLADKPSNVYMQHLDFLRCLLFGRLYKDNYIADEILKPKRYAAKFLGLKIKDLRVAVLISGQFRGGLHEFEKNIQAVKDKGFDVYIHTWKGCVDSPIDFNNLQTLSNSLRRAIPDAILNKFPLELRDPLNLFSIAPKFFKVLIENNPPSERELNSVFKDNIHFTDESEFESTYANRENLWYRGALNQAKMWFGMYECYAFMERSSREKNISYDLILKSRPDLPLNYINDSELLSCYKSNKLMSTYVLNGGIGDQFFCANPAIYKRVVSIWSHMIAQGTSHLEFDLKGRFAEWLLADLLRVSGVDCDIFRLSSFGKLNLRRINKSSVIAALDTDIESLIPDNRKKLLLVRELVAAL